MKTIKRFTALLLVLMMTAGLTACGSREAETTAAEEETTAAEETAEESTGEAEETTAAAEEPSEEETAYDYSAGLDEEGFFEDVLAAEVITQLPDYKNIQVPFDAYNTPDDEVDAYIENMMLYYADTEQDHEKVIESGDTVNIDYVGTVDGVEFAGGSTNGAGTDVTIGVTQYIDDFLEQLIGHKPGETFDVNVTFPDPYVPNEDLNGKDAVFSVTINYVQVDKAPELTDAFVEENFGEGMDVHTIAELKDYIRNYLEDSKVENYLFEHIITGKAEGEIPETVLKFYEDSYTRSAASAGITLDELAGYYDYANGEALVKGEAEKMLTFFAIAEKEGYKITEEYIADYFEKQTGQSDYSYYVEEFGLPFIKNSIIPEFVMEQLKGNIERLPEETAG